MQVDASDLAIGTLPLDHPDYHVRLQPVHSCAPGRPTHPDVCRVIDRAIAVCRLPVGKRSIWGDWSCFGALGNRGRYLRQRWAPTYRDALGVERETPLRYLDFSHGITPSLQVFETDAARQCWRNLIWRPLYAAADRRTKRCLLNRSCFFWRQRWELIGDLVSSGYAPVLNPPDPRPRGRPRNSRGNALGLHVPVIAEQFLEAESLFTAALATGRQWFLWSRGRYGMPWGDYGPPPGNYRHSLNVLLTLWAGVTFSMGWACWPALLDGIPNAGPSGSAHAESLRSVAGRVLEPGGFSLNAAALAACQKPEHLRALQGVYAAACTMLHAGCVLRLSGIPHDGFPRLPDFAAQAVDAAIEADPDFAEARQRILAGGLPSPKSGHRPNVDPAYAEPDDTKRRIFS